MPFNKSNIDVQDGTDVVDIYGKCAFFLTDILHTDSIKHSGRSLYDHLEGTAQLLIDWEVPEYLALAGLFHSIYGTSKFWTAAFPLQGRSIIANLIGDRAEQLAYEFCVANRKHFPWAHSNPAELYTIEAANFMEQKEPQVYVKRLMPWLNGKPLEAVIKYVG